jgi:hypothetical protein
LGAAEPTKGRHLYELLLGSLRLFFGLKLTVDNRRIDWSGTPCIDPDARAFKSAARLLAKERMAAFVAE